jgi:hypothetical protein
MQSIQRTGFHESTVATVLLKRGMLTLDLEGVHLGAQLRAASIRLTGVKTIIRDGVAVDDLGSEVEGDEVLTLEHTQRTLHLIIEWTDFEKHHSATHSYKIEGDSIEVEVH